MLPIQKHLTTTNLWKGRGDNIKYIVIHYTANTAGATAKGNCIYFETYREASAHYFVDTNSIWQCVEDNDTAWHCGGGLQGQNGHTFYGKCTNRNSIGIELVSSHDGKNYFIPNETISNGIELTKYLMKKHNISANNVIMHYDVTGKICPEPFIRNPKLWEDFKQRISDKAPVVNTKPKIDVTYQGYAQNKWWSKVKNYNNIDYNGYAGVEGAPLRGLKVHLSQGHVIYRVHTVDGRWYNWITDDNGSGDMSYAGTLKKNIDAVQIKLIGSLAKTHEVLYRVSTTDRSSYYNWINGVKGVGSMRYAGVFGKPIDKIQIEIRAK